MTFPPPCYNGRKEKEKEGFIDLQEKFNNMGITQRTLLYTAAVLLFFVALMFDVNTNYIIALILYFFDFIYLAILLLFQLGRKKS